METLFNPKSFEPKLKDMSLVGKIHSPRFNKLENPQILHLVSKSIGTNTPRTAIKVDNHLEHAKAHWPVTHKKSLGFKVRDNHSEHESTKTSFNQSINNDTKHYSTSHRTSPISKSQLVGTIIKQTTPEKSFVLPKYLTTNQLPSINKINRNQKMFKNFIANQSTLIDKKQSQQNLSIHTSTNQKVHDYEDSFKEDKEYQNKEDASTYINNYQTKQHTKYMHQSDVIITDPNYQHTLAKNQRIKANYYLPAVNFSVELPSQKLERLNKINQESPQLQSSRILPSKKSKSKLSKKNIQNTEENYKLFQQSTSGFIYNPLITPNNSVMIGIGTPISTIKQLLIESNKHFQVEFKIPQLFMHSLEPSVTQQQLHNIMTQIYSFLAIRPQIVSIKKYINCVMMKEKDLCILWHYQGKVYFGGWKETNDGEGHKHGLGLEWVPSKYVYYGQFADNNKHGYGIMKKSSKEIYIGLWEVNQKNGWGKTYNADGQLIENGQYMCGKLVKQIQSRVSQI